MNLSLLSESQYIDLMKEHTFDMPVRSIKEILLVLIDEAIEQTKINSKNEETEYDINSKEMVIPDELILFYQMTSLGKKYFPKLKDDKYCFENTICYNDFNLGGIQINDSKYSGWGPNKINLGMFELLKQIDQDISSFSVWGFSGSVMRLQAALWVLIENKSTYWLWRQIRRSKGIKNLISKNQN